MHQSAAPIGACINLSEAPIGAGLGVADEPGATPKSITSLSSMLGDMKNVLTPLGNDHENTTV